MSSVLTQDQKAERRAARERNVRQTLQQFNTLPDSAGVRVAVVSAVFGISIATVWRWTRDGLLPQPRRVSPKVTTWPVGGLREVLSRSEGIAAGPSPRDALAAQHAA
jgi:predicted DNA-binding transcriptional regulator AlpA